MKFHGITMAGPFVSQKLAALPTFDQSKDQGRIVWLEDGTIWYGSDTEWRSFASSDMDALEEEDFYSDLLRTTIFLNASYDGFANTSMVSSTNMTYSGKANWYEYTTGQSITSTNLFDSRSNIPYVDYVLVYANYTGIGFPSIQVSSNGGANWFTVQNGKIYKIPEAYSGNDLRLRFTATSDGILESWGALYNKDLSSSCSSHALTYRRFIATEGQDTFIVNHTPGVVQVFLNGDLLDTEDFDSIDDNAIKVNTPLSSGDVVYIVSFTTSAVQSDGDFIVRDGSTTYTGNQSMGGNKITDVANGVLSTDVATVGQVSTLVDNTYNFDTVVRTDGTVAFTNDVSIGGNRITDVANGVLDTDVATVGQVNTFISGAVTSVSGRTGDIILTKEDVGLFLIDDTSDLDKPISTLTQTALDQKADLLSPEFIGIPRAPLANLLDSSDQIASTSFVKMQGYITDPGVVEVQATSPIVSTGGPMPVLSILPATQFNDGSMSATDKFRLDNLAASQGTVTNITTADGVTGGPISTSGTIRLTGQALAMHNLATDGIVVRSLSSPSRIISRTIASGSGISVTNGAGVNGNPTIANTDMGSDQNIFKSIRVDGYTDLQAANNSDFFKLVPGAGVGLALNNVDHTITISSTVESGDTQNIFKSIIIDGYTTIVAANNNDSLTFVNGNGILLSSTTLNNAITVTNDDRGSSQNIFKSVAVFNDGVVQADNNNDVVTFAAGTGVSITADILDKRLTIYNTDPGSDHFIFKSIVVMNSDVISATVNDDTLYVAAGEGVDLSTDALTKTLTISSRKYFDWVYTNINTDMYAGNGYFVDTSTAPVTMTLPLSASASAGDTVMITDVNENFAINNCTLNGNGNKINGVLQNKVYNLPNTSVTLVYVNPSYGWKEVNIYNT